LTGQSGFGIVSFGGEERMDEDLRKYLDQRFEAVNQRFETIDQRFEAIDRRFEATDRRIDERFEEAKRYFGVVAEGLVDQVRQVAEGHSLLIEGQCRLESKLEEVKQELGAMIRFSYAELDRRMSSLELQVSELDRRLRRLEHPS
jgi:chaperonin cofactor prefoldin